MKIIYFIDMTGAILFNSTRNICMSNIYIYIAVLLNSHFFIGISN